MAGKTALIIGASRGIGLGLAKELAGRGYKVIATHRSASPGLAKAAQDSGRAIEMRELDVTDEPAVGALAAKLDPGSLDLLVMNAGVYGGDEQAIADLNRENVADIMFTNAVGPIKAAMNLMGAMKDGGTVVMMTSKMGSISDSSGGVNLYRISKVSQNMLARSLFEQHGKDRGIAVLSIHPGWVQTDMGGPNALITVEQSVSGIADLIEQERPAEHLFLSYDGQVVPW